MQHAIKTSSLAALVAALGAVTIPCVAQSAGIDEFQNKLDKIAAEHGVKAPDVKKELAQKSEEQTQEENFKDALSKVSPIERVVAIDANTIRAIKSKDGKIMYMIDNGRFVLVGKMVDIWNRKELRTIEDIADAVSHIDLEHMGFTLDKVNHMTVGKGAKHVTIFVDPQCGWCHRLMNEINALGEALKDYTFDFVIVPLLGDRSTDLAKKLYCAKADDATKYKALTAGARQIGSLEQKSDCDLEIFNQTRVIAQAVGVQSVPMVISHDGRFNRGKPQDLMAFLEPPKPDAKADKIDGAKGADAKAAQK